MIFIMLISAQPAATQPVADQPQEIVVTAARTPQDKAESAASVTVIDSKRIERLGAPLVDSLLRLTPSAAVAVSGPAGSFTEVRIRGAEANHSLLFVDGIRANDPAAGNVPRFELLNADLVSSLEVVRGPQSALWGSEAIGGVIAVNALPDRKADQLSGEIGANGFRRASASATVSSGTGSLAAGVGWQRASGIDSFSGEGDKDGYRNLSARIRGSWRPDAAVELGASGFVLTGKSQFDGVDLLTFVHADTLDETRNRLAAGRLWASFGRAGSGLSGTLSTSLLRSSNRNSLESDELNRTQGKRWTAAGQLEYRFATGTIAHSLVAAAEHDREHFRSRDQLYGGATNQDRSRSHQALTGEWRAELSSLRVDLAVRHDRFSRFANSTAVRGSALLNLGGGVALAGSYAEGIAQPTFFDLYGFFPGNFVGNPALKPESSRGVETSLRYRNRGFSAALTVFRQRLSDEIVDVFDPATFQATTVNRGPNSRRSGIEAELSWALSQKIRLGAYYTFLDASEPDYGGELQLREARRPKHSASIAADGAIGRLSYGASLAYAAARTDTNFDLFPAQPVRLGAYWLAGARLGYRLQSGVELFARASNLLDADYQEAFGYRTEGRALFAGISLSRR